MEEKLISIGEINLQIHEYENVGDAIIFLHFGGANLMMWQQAIPHFQEKYHLILVDLRGHGKSDKPTTGYHIDEMAVDILGLMKALGIEQAHIIGSSIGAEIGLSLAANHPAKVKSLVCEGAMHSEYGPYSLWDKSEEEFQEYVKLRTLETPEDVFPSIEAYMEESERVFKQFGWWNKDIEAVERYDIFKAEDGQYTTSWSKEARRNYTQYYFNYRFEDYYSRIKCPVLMLPDEGNLQNERAKEIVIGFKDLLAQGQIAEVSGWVHPYGWLLNIEEVYDVILNFFEDIQ